VEMMESEEWCGCGWACEMWKVGRDGHWRARQGKGGASDTMMPFKRAGARAFLFFCKLFASKEEASGRRTCCTLGRKVAAAMGTQVAEAIVTWAADVARWRAGGRSVVLRGHVCVRRALEVCSEALFDPIGNAYPIRIFFSGIFFFRLQYYDLTPPAPPPPISHLLGAALPLEGGGTSQAGGGFHSQRAEVKGRSSRGFNGSPVTVEPSFGSFGS
jgi:hypothetical protein